MKAFDIDRKEIKVGDEIMRVEGSHLNMGIGDRDIVVKIASAKGIRLKRFKSPNGNHAPYNFRVIGDVQTKIK